MIENNIIELIRLRMIEFISENKITHKQLAHNMNVTVDIIRNFITHRPCDPAQICEIFLFLLVRKAFQEDIKAFRKPRKPLKKISHSLRS